jgi:hypothetical protein
MAKKNKHYKINCWIPVEAEEPKVYRSLDEAQSDLDQAIFMQSENRYEIVECDRDGIELRR